MTIPHICVCICTFRRPELLRRLLEGLAELSAGAHDKKFTFSSVVVDNDATGSARPVVERFLKERSLPIVYEIEAERSFAHVRNRAVRLAKCDFVAFIDDDEVPVREWLLELLNTWERFSADGVLGPVRPYFDAEPPGWITKGRLCHRPVHQTGTVLEWTQTRTGNVLIKRAIFDREGLQFDPVYSTGGEDVDFFRRAIQAGYRFVWCEEAPVYELVPPERLRKSYFVRRALLQGRISLRYGSGSLTVGKRIRIGMRSLLAILLYSLATPVMIFGGFHLFMKYLIKLCHHLGRAFAVVGIELVRQRTF